MENKNQETLLSDLLKEIIEEKYEKSIHEANYLEQQLEQQKLQKKIEEILIESLKNQVQQKKNYSDTFLVITLSWLVFVMLIISANGIPDDCFGFSTSDEIILALLNTSLVSLLTPVALIAQSLFDRSDKTGFSSKASLVPTRIRSQLRRLMRGQ